ncbi:MAG TPA: response regulator [Flavisolibacter sp.]|nr:response regulator [Flavisolibacter sp.]
MERYLNVQGKPITVYNQKILLLDDNKDLLQIVQIILKGQGYETVLANCIEEAKQKIKIHKPALILMDVFISDQDGREFCNQLKNEEETSNIRVIMMSGYDSNLGLMSLTGADDFMQKPFDYNDLLARVQKQMSSSNQTCA